MSRRRNVIPTVQLELKLPADLRAKLDLYLWSDVEGRVPQGRYQEFFVSLLNEFFNRRTAE